MSDNWPLATGYPVFGNLVTRGSVSLFVYTLNLKNTRKYSDAESRFGKQIT